MTPDRPLVLCLSGHDPTGGAGLQADIEAVTANGGHALGIITAHTVQDTRDVQRVLPVAPALIAQQLAALSADCTISAIKIGLLGDAEQLPVILEAIAALRVPVVLDPVLRAGGGTNLAGAALMAAMQIHLLPQVTLLTPNAAEARRLAPGQASLDDCARQLLATGCGNVLVTGGDEPEPEVVNHWYREGHAPVAYRWPRLPETFHGAGCTLAAACATHLARGLDIAAALEAAQRYTQHALANARAIGQGRRIPGRC